MPSGIRGLILPTGRICVQAAFLSAAFSARTGFLSVESAVLVSALAGLAFIS